MIRAMKKTVSILSALALVVASLALPVTPARAAATSQTTHAFLCLPPPSSGILNRYVTVPTTGGGNYTLNGEGCALVAGADIGWFLSQGAFYGPNLFTLQQRAITASTTASTSTITLPAYGYIYAIVLSETAGNAITGGVDIGDSGSATRFASAVTLAANATVAVADSALTRLFVPSGVPTADQILVACHTACNSGSINITIIYGYF